MTRKDQPRNKDSYAAFRIAKITQELAESDPIIIRALEDLMMLLLQKQVIAVGEIHPTVVETIIHRKELRKEMNKLEEDLQ